MNFRHEACQIGHYLIEHSLQTSGTHLWAWLYSQEYHLCLNEQSVRGVGWPFRLYSRPIRVKVRNGIRYLA